MRCENFFTTLKVPIVKTFTQILMCFTAGIKKKHKFSVARLLTLDMLKLYKFY